LIGTGSVVETGDPDANPCSVISPGGPSPIVKRSWNGFTKPTQLLFPEGATAEHILEPCVAEVDDIEDEGLFKSFGSVKNMRTTMGGYLGNVNHKLKDEVQ